MLKRIKKDIKDIKDQKNNNTKVGDVPNNKASSISSSQQQMIRF